MAEEFKGPISKVDQRMKIYPQKLQNLLKENSISVEITTLQVLSINSGFRVNSPTGIHGAFTWVMIQIVGYNWIILHKMTHKNLDCSGLLC